MSAPIPGARRRAPHPDGRTAAGASPMPRMMSLLGVVALFAGCAAARPEAAVPAAPALPIPPARPIPYPAAPPAEYRAALERGTRTEAGTPGPRYWQQWASYRLHARIVPDERRLDGRAAITYHNRSPDSLTTLHLDLHQNLHAEGAMRNEEAEVTGGVQLTRVALEGRELGEIVPRVGGYQVMGTRLIIRPPRAIAAGDSVRLEIDWRFTIPQAGAGGRMGHSGDDLLFLAYWYPHFAVYDDVVRWHPDRFLGLAEFYHGFGSYELTVDAPAGWVVRATGALQNPEAVLPQRIRDRLDAAAGSDTVVRILGPGEFGATATLPGTRGRLQWRFRADSVRDVAFSLTRRSIWEAARTPIGDRTGDGRADSALVETLYRETAPRWRHVTRFQQHALRLLSEVTGMPYPWPHMTAVEGARIIGGGMEFPMLTLMGDYTVAGDSALYYVTAHELAHMWIPMIVGTDERRYSWMDEGATSFAEGVARMDFYPGYWHHGEDQDAYTQFARTGNEGPLMRRSDFHYSLYAFGVASYWKPASLLVALRGLLGDETFWRAYREFIRRWAYRHPYPWDLFATVEDVSGRDLYWFWRAFYHETWTLDQAIASVTEAADGTRIVIEDRGEAPMPVRLRIVRQDGDTLRREVPVEHWLRGERTATVTVPAGSPVIRVEIDPERHFPDVDRGNNVWRR